MPDATMQIDTQVTITDTKGVATKYPISTPAIASQKEILRMEIDVPAEATVIVWDPNNWTGFPVTAFQAILFWSDQPLLLEEVCNEGDSNAETNLIELSIDTPYILGSNKSTFNRDGPSIDAFAGTNDVIDRIRVKNESTTNAAKLFMMIVDDS